MKKDQKYDDYKEKVAASMKKQRDEMVEKGIEMTDDKRDRSIKKCREAVRKRVKKCRERKKNAPPQSNDSMGAIKTSYSTKQKQCHSFCPIRRQRKKKYWPKL